jgi:hypothetical protein
MAALFENGPLRPFTACIGCCFAASQTCRSLPVQMGRKFASLVRNVFAKQVAMAMQYDDLVNCVRLFFVNDMS